MHGSGPPLDPYPRDDEVREAPLSDKPPSPARSKASRSNSPGSFELDDFLEKDEAYRAIMSETMGDGLAQNFLFDDSPPRQQPASPPRQQQPSPQQRTFNGKQPPSQKPPPRDFVDDARPPRTAAEATRRAASLAARYHGVVADDLLPEGEAPEVYAAAIAGAYRDEAAAAAAARPRYATRSRDRRTADGGWAAPEPRPPPGHTSSGPAESGEYSSPWSGDDRGTGGGSSSGAGSKGRRGVPQVQRRRERNQREQKRSNEISSQIDGLRRVLTDAGVAVKASKSAILVGTAQYIRALQRKHEELEAERRRMLSEMCVLLQQAPRVSDPPPEPEQPPAAPPPPPVPPSPAAVAAAAAAADARAAAAAPPPAEPRRPAAEAKEEEPIILARPPRAPDRTALDRRDDLDQIYELVFADSAVPMAVVTLDGKFLRTNVRFEAASGYGRTELERITVFNLTAPAHLHVTFSFMSLVLRGLDPASHLFVCAVTRESRPAPFALAMSLVTRDGRAQYFSMSLVPLSNVPPQLFADDAERERHGCGRLQLAGVARRDEAAPPSA